VAVLNGCVSTPQEPESAGQSLATQPAVETTVTTPAARVPDIAIVVSDDLPVFTAVARELARQHRGRHELYTLGTDDTPATEVERRVQRSDKPAVIAIGREAALLARGVSGKTVVFTQVFNYDDIASAAGVMKGVSATAPPREQFRAWKALAPKLTRVGVITGSHQQALIRDATAAARAHGITLQHVEVRADREMLYAYKQLSPGIQGLWLLPDNRVLSRDTLREVMAFSMKEGKQVLAFHRDLLELGALLSVETDPADVAAHALERLRLFDGKAVPGPAVTPLTRASVHVNATVAKRFGLTVPREFHRMAHAP
jgi:ABC-type uncharacterized transport system substrate-binding protein